MVTLFILGSSVFAEGLSVTIVNDSGFNLSDLAISPAGTNQTGNDVLKDAMLGDGQSRQVVFDNYDTSIVSWDIIGHDCCGEEHDWQGVQLSQGQTITLNNTGKDGAGTMNMKEPMKKSL
ncbi:hypothetical protein [Pectinatus frisingensis]|jgi:hypothetical protein|uniref:hypothetical protein n=1 Tax=Pectinatus frisingensis TaxID=865 RepID=UPI003D800AB9